jgi:hypothetical protein
MRHDVSQHGDGPNVTQAEDADRKVRTTPPRRAPSRGSAILPSRPTIRILAEMFARIAR